MSRASLLSCLRVVGKRYVVPFLATIRVAQVHSFVKARVHLLTGLPTRLKAVFRV